MEVLIKQIAIVGLGLIGGSLGKALKKRHPQCRIIGIDVENEIVRKATEAKVIDRGTTSLSDGLLNAELVFLAVPVQELSVTVRRILPLISSGVILTDVCSTKENVVAMMEEILPDDIYFVGGHPMAGSEKWGLEGVDDLLFENAVYILTSTAKTSTWALAEVRKIVELLGARVIILTPEEHDKKVAAVSHLPHVVASALINTVGKMETGQQGYLMLAAGGLRDTTRIALSNSELWSGILLSNEQAVLPMIKEFKKSLSSFERSIKRKNSKNLNKLLLEARLWRRSLPTGMKGILPQIYELNVAIPDQPGMIGKISTLLGKYAINIIDIEVQRVREGENGAIRLGFAEEKGMQEALRILEAKGYKVRESSVG